MRSERETVMECDKGEKEKGKGSVRKKRGRGISDKTLDKTPNPPPKTPAQKVKGMKDLTSKVKTPGTNKSYKDPKSNPKTDNKVRRMSVKDMIMSLERKNKPPTPPPPRYVII